MNIFSGESEPEAYVGWGSLLLCSNIDIIIIINAINTIITIMIMVFSPSILPSWPSSLPQSSIALSTITFVVITSRQDSLKWVWWTSDYDQLITSMSMITIITTTMITTVPLFQPHLGICSTAAISQTEWPGAPPVFYSSVILHIPTPLHWHICQLSDP